MQIAALDRDMLRAWFAQPDQKFDGFREAIEDDLFGMLLRADAAEVQLPHDGGKALLPGAEQLPYDEQRGGFGGAVQGRSFDQVVLPDGLQRVVNPFTLLRAIYPILKVGGTLLIAVPLRDGIAQRYYTPSSRDPAQRRFYTLSSLFLELQAAWGFNGFRVRFAREYDGSADASATSGQSLMLAVEKQPAPNRYEDVPQIDVKRTQYLYNRSQDERLLSIDLSAILSPEVPGAQVKRICLLKIDQIGDFIMAVPAFDEIRALFPEAEITCVCGSWNADLARQLGCFDKVVLCDYQKQEQLELGDLIERRAATVQRLGTDLADVEFDLAIDLRVPEDVRDLILAVRARYRAAIGSTETFPYLDIALPSIDAFHAGLRFDHESTNSFVPVDAFGYRRAAESPPGMRLLRPVANEGEFIFGPYMPLARGAYRATWLLSTLDAPVNVSFDVSLPDRLRDSADPLREEVIAVGREGTRSSIAFELYTDVPRIEFRARLLPGQDGAALLFSGVRLETMSGRPAVRHMAKPQLHMKEQLALLVALVRSRLLPPARPAAETRLRLGADAAASSDTPFFAIAPCSSSELRDWPIQGFVALCRALVAQSGAEIRLIGSADQRALLDNMVESIGSDRVRNCAGEGWSRVYAGLAQAEAVISNNSGIGHLAAWLGANVLALYSGSHQVLEWGPVGPRVTTLQASLPCGACGFDTLLECQHGLRCQHIIDPASVVRELRRIAAAAFLPRRELA